MKRRTLGHAPGPVTEQMKSVLALDRAVAEGLKLTLA